MHGKGGNSGP
jgi:ATP-dependent Zn protease